MAASNLLRQTCGVIRHATGRLARQTTAVKSQRWMSQSAASAKSPMVSVNLEDGIATLTMDKKPVNSLNLDFLTQLAIAVEKLENDRSCKGVVLTSALPTIFSAGLDIMEMYQKQPEHLREFWRAVQEIWLKIYGSNMAFVAAITGHAPAGGCLLSLCCDYRIMAENYGIGLNETQLGIIAPFWFVDSMVKVVGEREAERGIQLGHMYSTQEALKVGLVDQSLPQDQVLRTAQQEVRRWTAIPTHARQIAKSMMRRPLVDKLLSRREDDIKTFVDFINSAAAQKGMEVYLENLSKKKSK